MLAIKMVSFCVCAAVSATVASHCSRKLDWVQIRNRKTVLVNGGVVRNFVHIGRAHIRSAAVSIANEPSEIFEFFSLLSSREI
jgi:hypothetical protein